MDPKIALYIVAGAIFVAGLVFLIKDRSRRGRCKAAASATIVDVLEEYDSEEDIENPEDRTPEYRPVFEFTAGEHTVSRTANISTSRKRTYKVGDVWPVKYNPADPNEFIVDDTVGTGARGFILMGLGAVMAVIILLVHLGVFGG